MITRALIAAALFLGTTAHAFESIPLMGGGPPGASLKNSLRYSGRTTLGRESQVQHQSLSAFVPVWRDGGEQRVFALQAQSQLLHAQIEPRLPAYDVGVSGEYWRLQAGASYIHDAGPERHSWGVQGSVGSASDKPFTANVPLSVDVTSSCLLPKQGKGQWVFAANYSNTRAFLNHIPLVGAVYLYSPSETLKLTLGVPVLGVNYKPDPKWVFYMITMGPWFTKAQLIHFVVGPIQAFVGFDWQNQKFYRAERQHSKETLFFDEMRYTLGLRSPLSRVFFAELSGGYAIARKVFEGSGYYTRNSGVIKLKSSAFMSASLSASF